MTKETLSDKRKYWSSCAEKMVYPEEDVKEFIKRLENKKQVISSKIMECKMTAEQGFIEFCDYFDKIVGEKLI